MMATTTTDPRIDPTTGRPYHRLNFPPFPSLLHGESLPSFDEFLASKPPVGIVVPLSEEALDADDYVERDAHGVPTVALLKVHDTDEMPRKKKVNGVLATAAAEPNMPPDPEEYTSGRKKFPWEEQWDATESSRRNAYDPNVHPVDRMREAADDFRSGRPWPGPGKASVGPLMNLWNQFLLYAGLHQHAPGPGKKKTSQVVAAQTPDSEGSDSEGDDEDLDVTNVSIPADIVDESPVVNKGTGRKKSKVVKDAEKLKGLTFQQKLELRKEEKDAKILAFFYDPEKNIKIFFSSYFRDRGLLWSEGRCHSLPILVSFFLAYLIRSSTFPEPDFNEPLVEALRIAKQAKLELQRTFKISRTIGMQDAFSEGCITLWGTRKASIDWGGFGDGAGIDKNSEEAVQKGATIQEVEDEEEREAKRRKLASDDNSGPILLEAIAEGAPVIDTAALLDNPELAPTPESDSPGWGSGNAGTGWGSGAGSGSGWGAGEGAGTGWGGDGDVDMNGADGTEDDTWTIAPVVLFPLLGPTNLPHTHETGIVENSTRRIVDFFDPVDVSTPSETLLSGSAAAAVEDELERRFARVVLEPWFKRGDKVPKKTDVIVPEILETSQGKVVGESGNTILTRVNDKDEFDPWMDEVVLLVERSVKDVLLKGMGLGATWIEIKRIDSDESDRVKNDADDKGKGKGRGKGKGKGKVAEKRKIFVYMEQMVHVLPSFHMDPDDEAL